jgi:MFS family permease
MPPKDTAPHPHPQIRDFRRSQIFALFAVLCAVISVPVLTHKLPPLSDYVNHLARMYVIDAQGKDAYLDRFYEIHWEIIPNLMMDMVVPAIAHVVNIYLAGQFFLLSIFVLILSGTLALNRALTGRWSALPLIAAPLLYNNMLLVGVANYLFGIGLVLWALAVWVALRNRPWPWRYTASAVFVIALFFCHLVSVALYGLSLFAFEVERLWRSRGFRSRTKILEFCSAGIPFLPVLPLLYESPTMGLATENYWEQNGKLDGLMFVFSVYSDYIAFALIGVFAAALVWAVRHKLVRFPLMGWILLVLGGAIYLAMPRVMFSVYMADQRIPIGLAFMLIACLNMRFPRRAVRYGFAAVLAALVCLRVGEVQVMWNKLSKGVEAVHDSVQFIDRGARVLVAYADPTGGDDVRDLGLVHAACLAMIERSALVTTAFTVPGKQILRVRSDFADEADTEDGTPPTVEKLLVVANNPEIEEAAYWSDWTNTYDYVYVLFTEKGAENPDPVHLRLVYEGRRFQLYRMANPHTTTAASASAERLKKKNGTRVD